MAITQRGANLLLDALTGRAQASVTAYAALSSTKPNVDGTNFTEPTATEYARPKLGAYSDTTKIFGAAAAGATSNTSILYFPEARSSYPRQTYIGIANSPSGAIATSLLQFSPILVPEYVAGGAEVANAVTLDYDKQNDRYVFLDAVSDAGGDYEFTYDGTNWKLNGTTVNLSDYGITIANTVTPASGDTLTVYFGITPQNKTIPIVRVGAWTIKLY